MVTFVAIAHNETIESYTFISSLLLQKDNNWKCIIFCDGKNDYIKKVVNTFEDNRITYVDSEHVSGFWGHYNRIKSLEKVDTEFLIQTSIQDYYTPNTVSELNKYFTKYDLILFDCIHNHFNYNILQSKPIATNVDWGCHAIRTTIAKKVGINHPESNICDGLFVEECINSPDVRYLKINKVLTIHN